MIARVLVSAAAVALTAPTATAADALRLPYTLPGWDEAAASAGCLAMASSVTTYLPAQAAQVRAEGEYWRARLQELVADESDRIEYWESAHEWLNAELRARDEADARDFLMDYRGQCIVAHAAANSAIMWGMAQ